MKNPEFMNKLSRGFHTLGFELKKHSPEIMIVAGAVGVVASAVMACKATLKVNAVLEETKESVETIHEASEKGHTKTGEVYTAEDSKKDLTIVYTQTGLKFVKLYGPAIALGALSLTGMLASNNILRKRNIALAAAYTAVDKGFKDYRGRVVDRFGEELDRELRYNLKAKEIEETVVNENGEEETVKKTVTVIDSDYYSEYSRFYTDGCKGHTKDPHLNLLFLRRAQDFANEKCRAKGHLFLNEAYEMLGIPKTAVGQVVGWIYKEDRPIDFGIYDLYKENCKDFVNGYEATILLDFNVDGNITDLFREEWRR